MNTMEKAFNEMGPWLNDFYTQFEIDGSSI